MLRNESFTLNRVAIRIRNADSSMHDVLAWRYIKLRKERKYCIMLGAMENGRTPGTRR